MARLIQILFCLTATLLLPHDVRSDVSGRVTVIDGDTFDVDGTRVRLFGIDAVESDQTCTTEQDVSWSCGVWVTSLVTDRFGNKTASCEKLDTDRYGRIVARCYIDGKDVARQLVQDGLAFAYRRYSMDYDLDEKAAAIRGEGLHGNRVQRPAAYREGRTAGSATSERACAIKGNISAKGVRIYHSPGQRDYDRTTIREEQGERWFCSKTEAEAAGWRAARR
mgnify:CR=1 FL=1